MTEPLYTAEATVTGGRRGTCTTRAGGLQLTLRVPEQLGGPGGEGTDPEELFAAGYGACFQSALGVVARRRRIRLPDSSIRTRVSVDRTDDGLWMLSAELVVSLPGLDPALAEELVAEAHQVCPYSRATRGNMPVTTRVVTTPSEDRVSA
jgi:lipoyl-dependent peroxiredoxin